jgi:NCAIR mutase (PurE)-related protein
MVLEVGRPPTSVLEWGRSPPDTGAMVDDAMSAAGPAGQRPGVGLLARLAAAASSSVQHDRVVDAGDGRLVEIETRVRRGLRQSTGPFFLRNVRPEHGDRLCELHHRSIHHGHLRLVVLRRLEPGAEGVDVNVVTAGTADLPVAEEVAVAARAHGLRVHVVADVGVAGLHRLLAVRDVLELARCTIALAGMEGALPPVVARLVSHPVIGVPTSVGYGASLGGLTALVSMQGSGAPSLQTTGIDQGVEAAILASNLLRERS